MTMISTTPARDLPKLPFVAAWLAISVAILSVFQIACPTAAALFLAPYYVALIIDIGLITMLSYVTLDGNL